MPANQLQGKRVIISIKKGATAEAIQSGLQDLYRLSGCPVCGLIGWDVLLHGGDPELYERHERDLKSLLDLGGITVQQLGGHAAIGE